jgi:acyl-CoA synthetase (AMP-forming)/AMP-acid ligase II
VNHPPGLATHERTMAHAMSGLAGFGDRVALVCDGAETTYAELDADANRLANALLERGYASGERIALALGTGVDIIRWYVACARANIVAVPLPERLTDSELQHQISDSGAVALVSSEGRAEAVARLGKGTTSVRELIGDGPDDDVRLADLLAQGSAEPCRVEVRPEDPFSIMYTGGSTGASKAAIQTHQSWACGIDSVAREWSLTAGDRHLHVLPLTHVSWFSAAAMLFVGGRTQLTPRWDPARALQTVQEERITVLNMIPTMLGDLIRSAEAERWDVSSVRHVTIAGSAMPAEMYSAAVAIFGDVIGAIYGMTETSSPISYVHPGDMGNETLRCAGKPGSYVTIGILDDDNVPVPLGEHGEIGLQGPQVTAGYLNQEAETEAAFAGGWFHTGDVGYVDRTGFLYIVDRKKDMIKTGGYNVYPKEVEEALYTHDGVAEAAVIGVADARWIEAVHAVVALKPGASSVSEEDLLAHVRERVSGYKVPKRMHIIDALPRTGIGKFDKPALRKSFGAPAG